MKLQEIEKISAYLDGECVQPAQIASLIESDIEYKKVYNNFKVLSSTIQSEFNADAWLSTVENDLRQLWENIDRKLEEQDQTLSSLLRQSLGKLPPELENLDLCSEINDKLDRNTFRAEDSLSMRTLKGVSSASTQLLGNWELLLNESFKLPEKYEQFDLWEKISRKLDGQYHPEIFTNDPSCLGLSDKEKYVIGLSEFLDGELLAAKAQMINDHLLECSDCRRHYVSLSKLKQALKYGFQTDSMVDIWSGVEFALFASSADELLDKKAEGF